MVTSTAGAAVSGRAGTPVAAVDLGAASVRVCVCDLEARPVAYETVHRMSHGPVRGGDGVLRWDWPVIRAAVYEGLERARSDYPLASVGIDTWGVDYGLLGGAGDLLGDPVCYRDARTAGYGELVGRVGAERMFDINGLQIIPINTIFQLYAEDRALLGRARHLLSLPELLVHDLTGEVTAETTSAGTTGLVDQRTGTWSEELAAHCGIETALLPEIGPPATPTGAWQGVPVHLVAGHDTASAVVGIGAAEPNPCFVSSGTWLLAGQELPAPVLTAEALAAGYSNEYGPEGTRRFLRNVAGFWILEECCRQWNGASPAELLEAARSAEAPEVVFDATDERFLAPADMVAEVCDAAGLAPDTPPPVLAAVSLNSVAATVAGVLGAMSVVTGAGVKRIHLVGGGVRSPQFVDRLGGYTGLDVAVGAAEAAVLGNALVQGIALGCWGTVAEARGALWP